VRLAQLKAAIEPWLRGPPPEPSAAIRSSPLVDLAILEALVGDDPATIAEVLQAFRESALLSKQQLDAALSGGVGSKAADVAHQLKGAAMAVGAVRLGELCGQVEDAGRAGNAQDFDALLRSFASELEAVLRFAVPAAGKPGTHSNPEAQLGN
jgi:HPt (histidine-containing phosphotransfer) domain-containing protein